MGKIVLFLLLVLNIEDSFGQFFEKAFKPIVCHSNNNIYSFYIYGCLKDENDNTYIHGQCLADTAVFSDSITYPAGNWTQYFAKYDKDLNLKWVLPISNHYNGATLENILIKNNGLFLLMRFNKSEVIHFTNDSVSFDSVPGTIVVKCDLEGNYKYHFSYSNLYSTKGVWDEINKRLVFSGHSYIASSDGEGFYSYSHLIVSDSLGNIFFEDSLEASAINIDKTGNIITATGGYDYSTIRKINTAGNILWESNIPYNKVDDIVINEKNEIFISGYYSGYFPDGSYKFQGHLSKISSTGLNIWDRLLNSDHSLVTAMTLDKNDKIWINTVFWKKVNVVNNGQVISPNFVGSDNGGDNENVLMQFSSDGELRQYIQVYGSESKQTVDFLTSHSTNHLIVGGYFEVECIFPKKNGEIKLTSNSYAGWDIFLAKLQFNENLILKNEEPEFLSSSFNFYPNPTKGISEFILPIHYSNCTYRLVNLQGGIVISGTLNKENKIQLSGLSDGVYIVELKTSNGLIERKKIIKN